MKFSYDRYSGPSFILRDYQNKEPVGQYKGQCSRIMVPDNINHTDHNILNLRINKHVQKDIDKSSRERSKKHVISNLFIEISLSM